MEPGVTSWWHSGSFSTVVPIWEVYACSLVFPKSLAAEMMCEYSCVCFPSSGSNLSNIMPELQHKQNGNCERLTHGYDNSSVGVSLPHPAFFV